jgi:putative transposase
VVTHLLADLVDRGLDASRGLVVLGGAKAPAKAVRTVAGDLGLLQRCTLHKRRNVTDHLPQLERGPVDARLARAFANPDPDAGLRAARELQDRHPSAAASLREGLEGRLTVWRLGVSERLARTLTSTNPVESMISIARTTCRNVKRWKEGETVRRWTAAGAGRQAQLRSGQGMQGHAGAGGRVDPSRRGGDRHHRRIGCARAVTELQQRSGVRPERWR